MSNFEVGELVSIDGGEHLTGKGTVVKTFETVVHVEIWEKNLVISFPIGIVKSLNLQTNIQAQTTGVPKPGQRVKLKDGSKACVHSISDDQKIVYVCQDGSDILKAKLPKNLEIINGTCNC
ncbi:hypothetical protein [Thalassoroseus pseudoceratinae]|uniref:hypothetical protein n=1 Tax=Thalassoroseus pseudoceratinae TaxID=2713176 RepID=UPI001423500B|nr:hypothetical protein [Thalassoroseus pseudoceratinae]